MTFGEKLQSLRAREGLSQDALAEALDVSRQAVSKWERDEAMPEAEKIVRISRRFGVTTDYLLLEDAPERPTADSRERLRSLGAWIRDRGWLLGAPVAVYGVWQLLRLTAAWGNIAPLVTQGEMSGVQGMLWLLFIRKEKVGSAAGALLAGLFWLLWGRRRSGELRWYHAGWPLVIWGAISILVQCGLTALIGLAAAPELTGEELAQQMALVWQGMGARAVYGGGVALVGLALAVGGRRLDSPKKTES